MNNLALFELDVGDLRQLRAVRRREEHRVLGHDRGLRGSRQQPRLDLDQADGSVVDRLGEGRVLGLLAEVGAGVIGGQGEQAVVLVELDDAQTIVHPDGERERDDRRLVEGADLLADLAEPGADEAETEEA